MPSSDLIRAFMEDTKKQFEKLEAKMDRQFLVGLAVILILAGPKGWELGMKVLEVASATARGK